MPKSTTQTRPEKPSKPYPEFPLFPHATRRWAKKVRGKLQYFGPWRDPDGALELWLDQKDELLAGRVPRQKTDAATIAHLCNHFLTHKQQMLESGELAQRTFDRYFATCGLIVATLGKHRAADDVGPDDFQDLRRIMANRWGAVALGNEIQIVRSVFKHAADASLINLAVRFGPGFKKPTAKTLRLVRAANGPKLFKASDIKAALKKADSNMRAMLLLGINCGCGNTDLALLPIRATDLKNGWLDYPRPKTGIPRRIPLWPETVTAIRKCLAVRQDPVDPDNAGLLFISPRGLDYIGQHKGYRVTAAMTRLMAEVKIEGRTFYDLRRTFQTVAEGSRDLTAVQFIMGHAPPAGDMAAVYRQKIDDDRLRTVVDHVRTWLFPSAAKKRRAK